MNLSSPNELKDLSIAQRVAQHAASAPKSLAVKAGAEALTYGDLELRSNQLACHLQSQDAGPEALIGIFLDRSIDSVVSQLAVLKAGCAYLPLNPAAPSDRVAFMLRDARVSSVITSQGLTKKLPAGSWRNRLTGEPVSGGKVMVRSLLKEFPVALLVKETANA